MEPAAIGKGEAAPPAPRRGRAPALCAVVGFVMIAVADGRAGRSLDDPDVQARLGEPTAWMFGNEAWGLPPDLVALADEPVAVPIYGQAESLNLAAAAAVCLYASARAQRVHGEGGKGRCASHMRRPEASGESSASWLASLVD